MTHRIANIITCGRCPFSIYVHDFNNNFKFVCSFKKVWYKIPVIMFKSVWLEKRGKL